MGDQHWIGLLTAAVMAISLPVDLAAQEAIGATDGAAAVRSISIDATEGSGSTIALPAQDSADDEELRYAAGFQSSFPAYGLSFMIDMTKKVSLQGVVGPFGSLRTYAGRGIYRFNDDDYHATYGYGMAGGWNYSLTGLTETTFGAGAGIGVEGDIRGLEPEGDIPPVVFSAEIGLALVNFNQVAYNFSTITAGFGIHYRF